MPEAINIPKSNSVQAQDYVLGFTQGPTGNMALMQLPLQQIVAGLTGEKGDQGIQGPQGPGYYGTSSTNLVVGTGNKVVGTQEGLAYIAGARARVVASDDAAVWMEGTVVSYIGGALTLDVDAISGAGEHSSWYLSLAGHSSLIESAIIGSTKHVWLGVRTDGKAGRGIAVDPFDASTAEKFDALMNSFTENTTINLLPGTYETWGVQEVPAPETWRSAWVPKSGQKLRGSGMGVTIIKLKDVLADADNKKVALIANFYNANTMADYFEISDLTLDANMSNATRPGSFSCIWLQGKLVAARRVRCTNFGNNTVGYPGNGEAFIMTLSGGVDTDLTYAVAEDCVFDRPYLSLAGSGGASILNGANVIRGCFIDGRYQNGFVAPFKSVGAIDNDRVGMNGASTGFGRCNIFENNRISNIAVGGPYCDWWSYEGLVVRGNVYHNVGIGPCVLLANNPGPDPSTYKLIVVEGNDIALMKRSDYQDPIDMPRGLVIFSNNTDAIDTVIIRNNHIHCVDDYMGNQFQIGGEAWAMDLSNVRYAVVADNAIRLSSANNWGFGQFTFIIVNNVTNFFARNNRRIDTGDFVIPLDITTPGVAKWHCDTALEDMKFNLINL